MTRRVYFGACAVFAFSLLLHPAFTQTNPNAQRLQQLKSQLTEGTKKIQPDAEKLAQMREELIDEELKSAFAGTMTAEQYLHAEANSIAADDVQTAYINIAWAWNDNGPCTQFVLCWTYIDSVGIKFSDGTIGPFVHIYRDGKSAHHCIQNALDALHSSPPNRGEAVEWVMASQIHNRPLYDWLKNHPDAVVTALGRIH